MRKAPSAALLLLLAGCAPVKIRGVTPELLGTLALDVGVLPIPADKSQSLSARRAAGLNAELARRMQAIGILRSARAVSSPQSPGIDVALDISPGGIQPALVRVLSARTGRQAHAFQPRLPFNEPGGLSPEAVVKGLVEGFSTGDPGWRALAAEAQAAQPAPTPEAAPAPAGISKAELESLVKAAVAGAVQAPKEPSPPTDGPGSEVDSPGYSLPERPSDFAVVVGIAKYSDLPEAPFADRDAAAVARHLIASGFPSRNVVVLSGQKAVRSSLEKYLELWLPKNVPEGGQVVFYFSGHGAPDPSGGQAYLMPWDGDPAYLEATGYPVRRLYEKLGALKARRVAVFLDACFSGAGGRSVLAKGARPLVTKVDAPAASGRIVSLAAAGADQITATLEEQGHGLFTYHLLKAWSAAALGPEKSLTLRGLHRYLSPRVQDDARRQNREQSPVLQGAGADAELFRFP